MSKAKLEAARELIREKNYEAARAILETMPDNSTALKWLIRLDEIAGAPAAKPVRRSNRTVGCLALLILGVLIWGIDAVNRQSGSPIPGVVTNRTTPPPTFTATASRTLAPNVTPSATLTVTPSATITETATPTITPTATLTLTPVPPPTLTATVPPLVFSGTADSVVGPVKIAAGLYRATITTAGYIIVHIEATEGDCGARSAFMRSSLFNLMSGAASAGAEALLTSDGCTALLEVSNVTQPWTLELEKIG